MNCYLSPKAIVSPSSSQQVSKVLALCRFLDATFSTRGGGHLQNPGFCSNDGGVVICLSKFREVTLSADKKTANIGVGLTWFEVYKQLDRYEVAVTGGRMPTVGVPGLLLGGGLSFQNSQYGFSCSGVVNYQVSTVLRNLFCGFSTMLSGVGCAGRLEHCKCQCEGEHGSVLGTERGMLQLR